MILPIGDSPNPPGKPWITYALIAANVLVFVALFPLGYVAPDPRDPELAAYLQTVAAEGGLDLAQLRQLAAQVSTYDLVVFRHGFRPGAPAALDVLTSMFLHGGLLHLLGNMLFLWIYGDNVEQRLGRWAYLAAYLGTGVAATAGDALLRMGSNIPSVGASGAISGVLGLYFVWFPRNRVRLWIFLFPIFFDVIEVRARLVLGFYVVAENLLPMLLGAGSGVSYGAHVGGFAAGLGGALLLDRLVLARPEADLRHRPAAAARAGVTAEALREDLDAERWREAAERFFGAPHAETRRGIPAREKIRLGDALARHGHPRAALGAYQRALSDHPRDPSRAEAHLGAARVLMEALGSPTAAYQHLYAALEADAAPEVAAEARRLMAELARVVRSLPRRLPD